jgi:hypothetical protein
VDRLDELLLDWYEWQASYEPALGYGRADSTCRDFRISRQWLDYDDLDAAVEANLKESVGKIIEPMILKLEVRPRLAINTAMRNFQAGYQVWTNPRYPETQDADYESAKAILCPQMVAAGLLERTACIPRKFVPVLPCGA